MALVQESFFIPVADHKLHLRCLTPQQGQIKGTVLLLHGAIENGRIFYTESNKGLASFLARHGYRALVVDLRGRGKSLPQLHQHSAHGQHESIVEDIPAVARFIADNYEGPQHWLAHSWGGVLMSSALARFPELRRLVKSQVYFGTKRSIRIRSLEKWLKIDLLWLRLAPALAKRKGFLNARKLKIGADNETHGFLTQSGGWVRPSPWVDPVDGFDYGAHARQGEYPPSWFIAATRDSVLGHPNDVQDFLAETANPKAEYSLLGKAQGNHHDYDHINMLTHPAAGDDHFPAVLAWLDKHNA